MEAVHRATGSQESLSTLANSYGMDQKTVAKWRSRLSPIFPPETKSNRGQRMQANQDVSGLRNSAPAA